MFPAIFDKNSIFAYLALTLKGLQKYKLKKYIIRVGQDPPSCPTNVRDSHVTVDRGSPVIVIEKPQYKILP